MLSFCMLGLVQGLRRMERGNVCSVREGETIGLRVLAVLRIRVLKWKTQAFWKLSYAIWRELLQ